MPLGNESDDTIPVVIGARWRLVDKVVRKYGFESVLVEDPALPLEHSDKYEVLVRYPGDSSDRISWSLYNPRIFHRGLELCHAFLELKTDFRYSFEALCSLKDGSRDSEVTKCHQLSDERHV